MAQTENCPEPEFVYDAYSRTELNFFFIILYKDFMKKKIFFVVEVTRKNVNKLCHSSYYDTTSEDDYAYTYYAFD